MVIFNYGHYRGKRDGLARKLKVKVKVDVKSLIPVISKPQKDL
jgi:hypothetical protein